MSKQIAITDSYLLSVFKLSNQDKKSTLNTIKQLSENPTSPSLHVHSIDRIKCDKKFLSARVNLDLRIIFVKREDVCTLLYVDHHDDAYDWCEGKYLVKTDFGSEYIYDEKMVQDKIDTFEDKQNESLPDYLNIYRKEPLFESAGIKVKDLCRLGIQEVHANNLLQINEEADLLEYIEIFPEELQEALIDIATGAKQIDLVYNQLFCKEDENEDSNSKRRFYLTKDIREIELLMENEDFEKWTIFLHPSQEKLVRMNANGPMVIEGGPGTGKTVVGIHRAAYLSENVYRKTDGKKILLCTYSKRLANTIQRKLDTLFCLKGIENNVDVMSVDGYIAKMVGNRGATVNLRALNEKMEHLYKSLDLEKSLDFVKCEYFEIVEKYGISTEEEYLCVQRQGMGTPLGRSERKILWKYFEELLRIKKESNICSFVDKARYMNHLISNGEIHKIYDSIIIDEAQDLESVKIKALCDSVLTDKNNVCILADNNQRIFRLNTWSKDVGIQVTGRTYYLTVNYRTTKQINDYARYQFMEFDMSSKYSREYISVTSGEEPTVIECRTESEENKTIIEKVKELLKDYRPCEICILAPTYEKLNVLKSIIEYEGMEAFLFTGDAIPENEQEIALCTTSGVKGLEFPIVIISSFNDVGTKKNMYGDSAEMLLDYEKLVECEKYVAITRARDNVYITYVGE